MSDNINSEGLLNSVLEKYYKEESNYDYLVFFSGGKDSTYLAHTLKKMKGGRVCLFTVDNGLEGENFHEHLAQVADSLKCDLYVYKPKDGFYKLFNLIIREKAFMDIDTNPICFFCNHYFMGLGIEFAEKNNIPVIVHGFTPSQLNIPSTLSIENSMEKGYMRNMEVFDAFRKKNFQEIYRKVRETKAYKDDDDFKKMMDKIFYVSNKVNLVYAFQYLGYNVERIKSTIIDELGWVNPVINETNENYISSGCRMWDIFLLMEKKIPGFMLHERKEFSNDVQKGSLSKQTYDYVMKMADDYTSDLQVSPEVEKFIEKVGFADLLLK